MKEAFVASSEKSNLSDTSPVFLSYVAALRNVKPRIPETPFTYAFVGCRDIYNLVCLAASNPEGQFFGIVANVAEVAKAESIARARHVKNIAFVADLAFQLLSKDDADGAPIPALDYFVFDETTKPLTPDERQIYFSIAEKKLNPGGLLAHSYQAYVSQDALLGFLVNEFEPEMNAEQAQEFLCEIKALGALYFSDHPAKLTELDRAIANRSPKDFFEACRQDIPPSSGIIDNMTDLLPRGFSLVGATDIGSNYMELSTPSSAHDILAKCRDHVLYEPLKDFAMNRTVRHDVWCRRPAEQTDNPVTLFGSFTFGISTPRNRLPTMIEATGKTINLRLPLLSNMIDVMALLPMSIGDFLKHPSGKDENPDDVLNAMQLLVAAGIAQPMRSHYESKEQVKIDQLKWATAFNRYLDDTPITDSHVLLASPTAGRGINVPARDALVMQAINRHGIAKSVDSLLPELMRVSHDPALAAQIMDTAVPTQESAHNMVNDVLAQSMVHWYAYGLLAA